MEDAKDFHLGQVQLEGIYESAAKVRKVTEARPMELDSSPQDLLTGEGLDSLAAAKHMAELAAAKVAWLSGSGACASEVDAARLVAELGAAKVAWKSGVG